MPMPYACRATDDNMQLTVQAPAAAAAAGPAAAAVAGVIAVAAAIAAVAAAAADDHHHKQLSTSHLRSPSPICHGTASASTWMAVP